MCGIAGIISRNGERQIGATVHSIEDATDYAFEVHFAYDGDLKALADRVEDVRGAEVLSLGHSLQIVKDLGDAESVAERYRLGAVGGSHAIGHVRMATESDVDISGAHPYWAYPFSDVAVVHNGPLTNYWQWERRLERAGHRFQSMCVSEIDGQKASFDAKELTTRQVNLELRWLLYEQGMQDVTVRNPGAKHSLGV